MKALVLSGEAGTRLWPLMHTSAERLVPVANNALRCHGPASVADAGPAQVRVSVGDTAAHIREAVGIAPSAPHPGPFTSAARNRRTVDSEAGFSLVLRSAPSEGVARAESSTTGPRAEVSPAPSAPRAHHLVPAYGSKVQIPS